MEGWALVEIMGHKRYAGRVSEENVIGVPMLRIDVPAIRELPPFTKYFAAGAIYGITPCSETEATMLAEGIGERAVPAMFTGRLLTYHPPEDDADEVDEVHDEQPHLFVGVAGNEGGCDPCQVCGLQYADGFHEAPSPVEPAPTAGDQPHAPTGTGAFGPESACALCGRAWKAAIHDGDVPF